MFCFGLVSFEGVSFQCSVLNDLFLLSLPLPATSANHGGFDRQGSEFMSGLSSHWTQLSRDANVFWVWIILKLLNAELDLKLGCGSPSSWPNHAYLKASSLSYVG